MRTTAIAVTAAALFALTACSSSSDDAKSAPSTPAATTAGDEPTATPTPAGAADLEQAVKAYTAQYFSGDAKAYDALSKRCKGKIDRAGYKAVVEQAKADYGPDHPATDVKADVSGTLARVTYKIKGVPKLDQDGQPWAREGDAWKYDAC